MYGTSITTIV